jgi:predicted AAA+ superfamily ATPase
VLCRGGWPGAIGLNEKNALGIPKNYLDALCESDISKVDGVKRNPALTRAILKSYASQVSTINTNKSLYEDIQANYADVSDRTISDYLNVLQKLFIIEEIEAWNPNIRSKTSMRASPKKSMVDPSLAVAALGCTPEEIIHDTITFGYLFENLVNRDLTVYVNSIGGSLKHYRDRYGLECDNVINFHNGKYALVETKLGGSRIKEAEEHLISLKNLITQNEPRLGAPAFLMIVTGTDMAYTTESGVLIVPIGCLKN